MSKVTTLMQKMNKVSENTEMGEKKSGAKGVFARLVREHLFGISILACAAVAFAFPAAVAGQGRAFIVRLVCTAETAWTLPADVSFESDDEEVFADVEVGEAVALLFSEVAEGRFLVSRKTVKTVSRE